MNKNKKIVVINNKGGVGKTTSSNELFAPFLSFENNMEPTIVYEFDEENLHDVKYKKSECVKFLPQKISNCDLEDNIMNILLEDTHSVIDIGANKSTTYFLEALEKSALDQVISLVAIPISDGEQDTLNARNISYAEKLEELLTKSVIPDLIERLDEIFEEIADNKEATEDAKEEIEELREFKDDLQDILDDIESGDIDEDECKELIDDILLAQKGSEEEDFGFVEED